MTLDVRFAYYKPWFVPLISQLTCQPLHRTGNSIHWVITTSYSSPKIARKLYTETPPHLLRVWILAVKFHSQFENV